MFKRDAHTELRVVIHEVYMTFEALMMLLFAHNSVATIVQSIDETEISNDVPPVSSPSTSPMQDKDVDQETLEEDTFDDFDIDAPFDNKIDIGLDWPDLNDDTADNIVEPAQSQKDILRDKDTELINAAKADIVTNDKERQAALQFEDEEQLAEIENRQEKNLLQIEGGDKQNYQILFSGLEDIDATRILARFNLLSSLQISANETANGSQILRRAKTDVDLMNDLLRLEGYYDNLVEYRITENNQKTVNNDADINIILEIISGQQYRFGAINLPGLEQNEDSDFFRDALAFSKGDVVKQDSIVTGKANLQSQLLENGYAFAKVGEPDLLIDHARSEGDLTLSVEIDRKYRFGRIITPKNAILSGKHLEDIARFEQGDIFQQSNVDDLRQAIFATSLASSVDIVPIASTQNEDQVDLNVALEAAPLRTISGQVGFNTGEGFKVEASWEHRNFFPPEGALNIAGILGTREQAVGVTFRRSNFQGRDRVLTASFIARNQNLDAFNARSLDIGLSYERKTTLIFQKRWTWNTGIEYSLSDEEASFGNVISRELFNILSFPAGLTYDGSDNLLDPTKGFRLSARISPEISTGVDEIAYLISQVDGSAYQAISDNIILAGRVRLGSIAGANTFSIAPSRRNYSGGGGSVRGFGFQDIGPLDLVGNPIGGRGLAELAIEARYRIGSFGIVPFFDAGSVSNSSLPDFSDMRYAAGVGLRYYTSFGPVRIDVGTPLNRRAGDNVLAVAISLGQAF